MPASSTWTRQRWMTHAMLALHIASGSRFAIFYHSVQQSFAYVYRWLKIASKRHLLQRWMVCSSCALKKKAVVCPDPWREGARDAAKSESRKLNENKLLGGSKKLGSPFVKKTCGHCKQQIQEGLFCGPCSHKKGLCSMCGKQINDTKFHKNSNV
jgi:hypothetical protein